MPKYTATIYKYARTHATDERANRSYDEDTGLGQGDYYGNLPQETTIFPCALCGGDVEIANPVGEKLRFCSKPHKEDYYRLRDKRGMDTRTRLLQRAFYRQSIPSGASLNLLLRAGMVERLEKDEYQLTDSGLSLYYELGVDID